MSIAPAAPDRARLEGPPAVLLATLLFLAATLGGCFNTYHLAPEEFANLQRPDEVPKVVKALDGAELLVDRQTAISVVSNGGRRYPVTPFNFKMTSSQLVASDRDTLLMLQDLKDYDVQLLSTPKTVLLITAGVGVAIGLIVFTATSAGEGI